MSRTQWIFDWFCPSFC